MEELSAAVDAVIRRSEEERSAALDAAAVSGGEIKADDLDAITEQLERYSTVEHVLKAHPFRGINRKAQLKPCAWAEGDGEDGAPTECLFILKWGGELTALGEAQAESLGTRFRSVLYPGDEVGGLLQKAKARVTPHLTPHIPHIHRWAGCCGFTAPTATT